MYQETAPKRSAERRLHAVNKFAHRLAQRRSITITSITHSGLTNGEVVESRLLHIMLIIVLCKQSIPIPYKRTLSFTRLQIPNHSHSGSEKHRSIMAMEANL